MKKVKDFMSKDVSWSTPETSLSDVAKLMVDFGCGEIPLVESEQDQKILGVITDRDIVCRSLGVGKNPLELTARDCMSESVITGTPEMSLEESIDLMEKYHIRRLPIVDESSKLCGILSQADLERELSEKSAQERQALSSSEAQAQNIH